ncbi:MAG TPA: glycosyltransferase family 39 protein [Nitrososphaeraceae archaeon]
MNFIATSGRKGSKTWLMVCIPLVLSCITHFWNPVGFPPIYIDEGHYLRRTVQVLNGLGPQESLSVYEFPFDHPYFGQTFLAAVLSLLGYPQSLSPSLETAENSVKLLYEIPRLMMGVLAVIDTYLVFKIGERRYGRTVGFMSSTIFAVMPVTWFLRMILLENIMLPFLLSSILLFTYVNKGNYIMKKFSLITHHRDFFLVLFSGILFGLASFTKESTVTFIPLLGYLAFTSTDRRWRCRTKIVVVWIIPVIIISSAWPLYAVSTNQFNNWLGGVIYQVERQERGIAEPLNALLEIDPMFSILSILGTIFAIFRAVVQKSRDLFFFFWTVPYFLFLFFIGGAVKYFHFSLLVPVLGIEIGLFIIFISKTFRWKEHSINPLHILAGIAVFGFLSTVLMVSNNLTAGYIEMYSSILHALPQSGDNANMVTMIGKHWARSFYWIPKYVFNQDVRFKVIDPVLFPKYETKDDKVMLLLDKSGVSLIKDNENQEEYIRQIRNLYNNSTKKDSITENWTQASYPSYYPFTSLDSVLGKIGKLDIRTDY